MKKPISLFFSVLLVALSLGTINTASAQFLYNEGVDYKVLDAPLPLHKEGQKEVVEFFSYACPHCANLEPRIIKWATENKPEDTKLYQIPAVGGDIWSFLAHVKIVADKLELGHNFDQKYFDAIHKDNNRRLKGSKEEAIQFIVDNSNIDKKQAEQAWKSLQVTNNLRQAVILWGIFMNNFGSEGAGVPAVVVNGKYLVTASNDTERFFDVINFLLASTQP